MAQEQNYQVNYSINVDASQGTKQVIAFGEAVGKLVQAKASLTPAVTTACSAPRTARNVISITA